MEVELRGKRALITGANSGIGEGIALGLAEAGARVAINYVTHPEAAQALVDRIRDGGKGEALAVQADVSDPAAVAAMFTTVDEAWGGIDILVNNAGVDGARAVGWQADPAQWRRVIEIDLLGPFYCAREALQRMVPQKAGVVINITSVHEVIPWNGYSAYTSAKAGLSMMTKTLAQEAGPAGVRVLAVAPGAIKTPINHDVWSDPQQRADLLHKIPIERIGDPADIARAVTFLASEQSSYVTGTTVYVDGGMTLYPSFRHGG